MSNYTKKLWCAARLRQAIYCIETIAALDALVGEYLDALERYEKGAEFDYRPSVLGAEEMIGA